jgi:hypothetical protein
MATKIADLLDELDFFKRFAYRDLETLGGFLVIQHAKKGDVIFSEGDPGSHMLILTEGKMVISKGGEDGEPIWPNSPSRIRHWLTPSCSPWRNYFPSACVARPACWRNFS